MTNQLLQVLENQQPELEKAVAAAKAELDLLRQRCRELEQLIHRGRAALGVAVNHDLEETDMARLNLHESMELVFRDRQNTWARAVDICEAVNGRGLYRMRDGRPVEAGQIHARVRNYHHLFERRDGQIRLRYLFDTEPIDSSGAYEAAMTTITRMSDGAQMHVIVKLAYSVAPPEGESLEGHSVHLADERARRHIKDDDFEVAQERRWILTTHGWESENA